jgi:hypothetical protein
MEPCKNQKTQFLKNEKSGFWELQIFNSDRLLGGFSSGCNGDSSLCASRLRLGKHAAQMGQRRRADPTLHTNPRDSAKPLEGRPPA